MSDKYFTAGFGVALIELIKLHGHDEMARDVIQSCGYDLDDFVKADLEEDDINILRKALS